MGQSHSQQKNQSKNTSPTSKVSANMTSGSIASTVSLGAGCYWGTEKYIKINFQKLFPNSIKSASVGL